MPTALSCRFLPPVQACNAGLFISRGNGRHPDRVIDSHELIFVRSGTLGMFEEQRRFTLNAGQALLLRPGCRHGGTASYPTDLSFYWIHFRLRAIPKAMRPVHRLMLRSPLTVSRPDRLTELFRQFLDDQETGRLTPATADLMMTLLLSEAANTRPAPATDAEAAATLASRADLFIRLHFSELLLSTATIAAALRCNPDYLGRVFQHAYGRTLTDAIHAQRHRQARRLLRDSALRIKEIAHACGFHDAGYFRRRFHRLEGLAPVAFRRLYAHVHVNVE